MRKTFSDEVERGRVLDGPLASAAGERNGAFLLYCRATGHKLKVVISDGEHWKECHLPGEPWEHVSVSLANRCPVWAEMCWVKALFFEDEETVVQYHPPKSEYVNHHPYCLHLFRPLGITLPRPPSMTVGPKPSRTLP